MVVQSPVVGNMAGSAGGIIFQYYHGHTYGRAFPTIFHYQGTPAQYAVQTKYYGIRAQWLPIYHVLRRYIHKIEQKQVNSYDRLIKYVYHNIGAFTNINSCNLNRKFGIDEYDRFSLHLGNHTLYYLAPYYFITFWNLNLLSHVDFTPKYAHALYLCPDLQELQYVVQSFNAEHPTFIFLDSMNWFPDHDFEMFVALSDEQYFTNFFY